MEFAAKVRAYEAHLRRLGIAKFVVPSKPSHKLPAIPPLWRLYWKLGWEIPPPLFLSRDRLGRAMRWGTLILVVMITTVMGLVVGVPLIVAGKAEPDEVIFVVVFAWLVFGPLLAFAATPLTVELWSAIQAHYRFPDWDAYDGTQPDSRPGMKNSETGRKPATDADAESLRRQAEQTFDRLMFGRGEGAERAQQIIAERDRMLAGTRRYKLAAGIALLAYFIFVPARNALILGGELTALAAIAGLCLLAYQSLAMLIEGWKANRAGLVLVLRRFRERDASLTVLSQYVGRAARGLGNPLTIQDGSFRGAPSAASAVFQSWVLLPLVFATTLALALVLPSGVFPPIPAVGLALLVSLWVWFRLSSRFLTALNVARLTESSFPERLTRLIEALKHGRGLYGGVRVMTVPDARWQDAVRLGIERADAIIIDVSEVSEFIGWELRTALEMRSPRAVVLTWGESRDEFATRDPSAEAPDDDAFVLKPLPRERFDRLTALAPEAQLRQAIKLPYVRESRRFAKFKYLEPMIAVALARSFAAQGIDPKERAVAAQSGWKPAVAAAVLAAGLVALGAPWL